MLLPMTSSVMPLLLFDNVFCIRRGSCRTESLQTSLSQGADSAWACEACGTPRDTSVLQTEEMFRDDDTARGEGPASLERLVIERNLSAEQLHAALSKSGASTEEPDEAQLTASSPAQLDRPLPARANPMARIHELGATPVCTRLSSPVGSSPMLAPHLPAY